MPSPGPASPRPEALHPWPPCQLPAAPCLSSPTSQCLCSTPDLHAVSRSGMPLTPGHPVSCTLPFHPRLLDCLSCCPASPLPARSLGNGPVRGTSPALQGNPSESGLCAREAPAASSPGPSPSLRDGAGPGTPMELQWWLEHIVLQLTGLRLRLQERARHLQSLKVWGPFSEGEETPLARAGEPRKRTERSGGSPGGHRATFRRANGTPAEPVRGPEHQIQLSTSTKRFLTSMQLAKACGLLHRGEIQKLGLQKPGRA